jgi:hypothetical protein
MHKDDTKCLIIYHLKMYKHKTKTRLENLNAYSLGKRKIMLIITAFMIRMSNGMNVGTILLTEIKIHGTTKRLI